MDQKINFVDLVRQNRIHRKEFHNALLDVVKRAEFVSGKEVDLFEKKFAEFCQQKYCISINSGTDALFFALLAVGVGTGDEVITAPNSYFSTAMVIEHTGAKVVFADIDAKTNTIDPVEVSKKITSRTKVIIPIHLYGQPADMEPLIKLSRKHNLFILEDCCQAHGAKYHNRIVPYTGTGAFSYYPGKNLGCFGDGGALVTNNRKIAEMVLKLRNDGALKKYHHTLFGFKSRLDTIQAAILLAKLPHLIQWNTLRRQHAHMYNKLLENISEIDAPYENAGRFHVFHIYAIETSKRNSLQKFLFKYKIPTVIHYPVPIHLQPPYRRKGFKKGDFPVTERKALRILSLPLFPELKKQEIQYISRIITTFFKQ